MRYKEYNVNKVLEQSMSLFWKNSYNGCSINELVEKTGVNRFSLYHEFGNKEGILYQSLFLYRQRYCDDKLSILKSEGDLAVTLKDFYLSFLENSNPVPGCYIIHLATELADTDPKVQEFVSTYLKEIEELFIELLERHDYKSSDASFKARHLLGLYCTAMSFGLIHSPTEREKYALNGIEIILN